MRGVLLTIHVVSGSLGLVLGPVAMTAAKRRGRHTRAGVGYQLAMALLTMSAVGLAALSFGRLYYLAAIAAATQAAALGGWWVQERRPAGWVPVHVSLMCGSYISLVTALLVVNFPNPVSWVLPTVVGSPLIGMTAARHAARDRVAASVSG